MFNTLTCKVRFHITVWSLSKSIRASSFIENFPQISAKPIGFQRNLLGKLSRNRPFFTNGFSAKLASKIPAKFPRNRPFFPRICPWKSREIWLFFPRPTRSPDSDSLQICYRCTSVHVIELNFPHCRLWQVCSQIWPRHMYSWERSTVQVNFPEQFLIIKQNLFSFQLFADMVCLQTVQYITMNIFSIFQFLTIPSVWSQKFV